MNETPIAELIGWTSEWREDNDYADGGRSVWSWEQWLDADGNEVSPYPTVDDLLAWLGGSFTTETAGHAYDINIERGHYSTVHVVIEDAYSKHSAYGETLLAALEQAVRTIAAKEPA